MQARPSWHARRATSALLAAALTATAAAALVLGAPPPPADAGVPGHGITVYPEGYGRVHLGPLEGPVGATEHGYCVQARVPASGPADVPVATSFVDDPPLAAVLAAHRDAPDDLTQAAVGYLVHQRQERPGPMAGGDVAAAVRLITAATPRAVLDRADALLAEGTALAGPYTGSPGEVTGAGDRVGTIHGIALVSDLGHLVPGAPFEVTLTGPAVFDATGTDRYSGHSADQPLTLAWTATGTGDVGYTLAFDEAWRTSLTVIDLPGDRQDQLTYGNRPQHDLQEITVPGPTFPVVGDFRPQATTTVQDVQVTQGDALVDVLEFAAAPGDDWLDVDGDLVHVPAQVTWYGPFDRPLPQTDLPPADAPVAGVERVVAQGPGTVTTPGTVRATGDGFYTAVVTIRKADAGTAEPYVREDFTAPFFETAETAVNRFSLAHESETREFNVVPGGRAFDRITVTGYPGDHGTFPGLGPWQPDLGEATVTVYGPLPGLPDTPDVPVGTPVHWTDTVAAVDGVYDVGYDDAHPVLAPTVPTHPGGDYFVFVYAFAGDDRVEEFVSPFDDIREVFYVPGPGYVAPQAVTQALESAPAGGPIHDTALVTGSTQPGDHLVFAAYGPQDPAQVPVCDGTTLLWTSDPVEVTGPGRYRSGTTTAPDEPGAVYWVETLRRADGTVLHEGRCGTASETTLVTEAPAVRTTAAASQDDPVAGAEIWDVLTVTGPVPADAVTRVDLFHAAPGAVLHCAEPVWTTTVPLAAGPGEYRTARYRTTEPGTYGFVERTTTAHGELLSEGRCGEPSETLTVAAPPAGPLAVTGADVRVAAAVAVLVVVAGTVVVVHRARVRRALDEAAGLDG